MRPLAAASLKRSPFKLSKLYPLAMSYITAVKITKRTNSTTSATMINNPQNEADATSTSSNSFTIAISGASGLVGKALLDELKQRQYQINQKPVQTIQLVRHETTQSTSTSTTCGSMPFSTVFWNPQDSSSDAILSSQLQNVDAVINLSGENISTGLGPLGFLGLRPWTAEKKESVLASRIPGARLLANVVQQISTNRERPITYLCASGVGVYGYNYYRQEDNSVVAELPAADEFTDVTHTKGFLATVSRQWEEAANSAGTAMSSSSSNHRVVNLRFGVVISKQGGAFGKLYPIYYLGGGGVVGSGNQYFSYISARDSARAILHVLETPSLQGPINIVSANPCTYREFNSAVGRAMNRPTIVPLPSFAVNLLFGEMGQEMLLGGVKAKPSKLLESGFEFNHSTIDKAVESALSENI